MITLNSPSRQIVDELLEEQTKAQFWLKKHYHGDKGYDKMREELCDKCALDGNKSKVSDIVEYISQKGNRWMAFESAVYYPDSKMYFTMPNVFCYYETYASVGAFIPCQHLFDAEGKRRFVVIFTDHFFYRFCERLKVPMRSRWMIQKFVEAIPGFTLSFGDKNEQGLTKVDCRLPGSVGRGVLRKDCFVVEIRTFLTDKELNGKQLRETKSLREFGDSTRYEPMIVRQERLKNAKGFDEAVKELENYGKMLGEEKGDFFGAMNIMLFIMEAFADLGYAQVEEEAFWTAFGKAQESHKVFSFAKNYDTMENGEKARTLYGIIQDYGKRLRIKNFDARKTMEVVLDKWREVSGK